MILLAGSSYFSPFLRVLIYQCRYYILIAMLLTGWLHVSLIWFFPRPLKPRSLSIRWGKKTTCRSILVAFYEEVRRMKWLLDSLWSLVDTNQDPQDQPPIALHRNTEHTHTCMHVWLKASFHRGDWPNAISLSVDYHVIDSSSVAQSTRDRDYYAPVSPWMRGVHRSFTILYGFANYSGVC